MSNFYVGFSQIPSQIFHMEWLQSFVFILLLWVLPVHYRKNHHTLSLPWCGKWFYLTFLSNTILARYCSVVDMNGVSIHCNVSYKAYNWRMGRVGSWNSFLICNWGSQAKCFVFLHFYILHSLVLCPIMLFCIHIFLKYYVYFMYVCMHIHTGVNIVFLLLLPDILTSCCSNM